MISSIPAAGNRRGTGLLPPNLTQWDCENNGLDLRLELGLSTAVCLHVADAFALLPAAVVIPHGEIAVAASCVNYFRQEGSSRWSGMALRLQDGSDLIIYNDAHPETRVRATLMEEYFHIKLDHERSRIRLLATGTRERSYDGEVERIAYGSGAAALLPYCALKELVNAEVSSHEIARRFRVSQELVAYRAKVTRLYHRRRRQK